MKRILTTICALALITTGALPAFATVLPASPAPSVSPTPAPEPERELSCYYPISVEEYTYGPFDEIRVSKVYQLSLSDDPRLIPTDDFEHGNLHYYFLDMTRQDDVGVDTKPHTETVTLASDTNKMDDILQRLDAEMEVATEDGYSGTLRLDHTSVQVTTDGYKTSTKALSATRTYPNLSDADVSLIPKSITDNGKTLNLADVQWASNESTDGEGGVVTHYTATASYTGSSTSRYATGYTVTANYTGEVSKTDCQMVTYTAIFGSEEIEETKAPVQTDDPVASDEPDSPAVPFDFSELKIPLLIGAAVLAVFIGGTFLIKKIKRR